jgi:hypothetical protein
MDVQEYLENGNDYFLPNLSIDLVIIGYQDNRLKCLLLKIGEKWLLPGGYIRKEESVEEATLHILKERIGLDNAYFKFLSVFGDKNRRFEAEFKQFFKTLGKEWKDDYWFNNRFVTLVYYSLVNIEHTYPSVGELDEAFGWFDFDALPEMWMDHKSIVLTARKRLKADIKQEQMTYNLLPEQFTMPTLHQLHQTILEEKIDRSRFQKKMLASGLFERLPKLQKATPGRNPYLYRVK